MTIEENGPTMIPSKVDMLTNIVAIPNVKVSCVV